MMKGSDIGIQEKKAKLFNEWERFTSNERESIESYYHRFLKLMNDLKRNKHSREDCQQSKVSEQFAARMESTCYHCSSDQGLAHNRLHSINYLQQPMPNPKDITDPTTAVNVALALMAKAFKLNYLTPTNNNQRISLNPYNWQIAQPGMNMGQDRQMQMVGGNGENHFRQYARNLTRYNDVIGNQNQIGNGNLVAARAEGNTAGQNGNQIRCYNYRGVEEYDLMAAATDIDEIKEVNANCILMANLQQASTSGTQTDNAPVYDSDGSAENDNNVISENASVEQGEETVEQHPTNFEETRALYDSLYQNLAIEVEKVNSVNRKLKETNADLTTELARFKNQTRCFEISREKYDKLERCYQQSVYHEQCLSKKINALYLSTDSFYHTEQKMALGCQNPFYLKQAQKKQQSLYDGKVLLVKHDPIVVHDYEETLQLA
nr:hypothetical protein [Tanacetum cinerariifolium]